MTEEAKKIEAVLFAAGEAVSKNELARLVAITPAQLEEVLEEIRQSLTEHGITLLVTQTHAGLVTAPVVADFLTPFVEQDKELSKAAAETLAIIAYRGPISRYEIDVLRGVDSRRMVRQLLVRGLIDREAAGQRVPRYRASEAFLQHLGITTVQQLPHFAELSQSEKLQQLLAQEES